MPARALGEASSTASRLQSIAIDPSPICVANDPDPIPLLEWGAAGGMEARRRPGSELTD